MPVWNSKLSWQVKGCFIIGNASWIVCTAVFMAMGLTTAGFIAYSEAAIRPLP